MPTTLSPLRYPGGKTALYQFVTNLFLYNRLTNLTYAEPYAGGAGLALKLLFNGNVDRLVLNDVDPAIYSFWHCVLNRTDELCELVAGTPITTHEWQVQKTIFEEQGSGSLLRFGFSTLFLNRTNVSGVLKGGIIGGIDQLGTYGIDARFKRDSLIEKIRNIANHRKNIQLYNLDAIDFIYGVLPYIDNSFVNFDPPYVQKGAALYTNYYTDEDHVSLGTHIQGLDTLWMITYDDCSLIRQIYDERKMCLIPINYSAGKVKVAKEIGILCDQLELPAAIERINKKSDLFFIKSNVHH